MKIPTLILVVLLCSNVFPQSFIKLDSDFIGEQNFNGTIYLGQNKRGQFLARVNERGKVVDQYDRLLDTRLIANGMAMFVLSKDNELYISKRRIPLRFHHSSLVAGEDVICAGAINIRRGVIKILSDNSPMYVTKRKDEKPLRAVIKKLRLMRADLSRMRVFFHWNL